MVIPIKHVEANRQNTHERRSSKRRRPSSDHVLAEKLTAEALKKLDRETMSSEPGQSEQSSRKELNVTPYNSTFLMELLYREITYTSLVQYPNNLPELE